MKKAVKIIALLLCFVVILSFFASCGAKELMSYEDKTLSVNVYEFLLSRMKGTLEYYGYDVDSESFWKTVAYMDGTTYDEYFCNTIKEQAINYIVAEKLFDELGLSLSDKEEARVDEILAAYLKKAGSETKLNAELKEFGVNYDILREVYILEAKIEALKIYLFGKNGEQISLEDKEKFYNENYVAFRQIYLATYEYVVDKDRFGDQVYYTDEEHKAIAYDKVNGKTKNDEFGKPIKDLLGDPEYFTEDGRIAYDKVNGVLGYVMADKDTPAVIQLSDEKKAELYAKAQQYTFDCNGKIATFEEYVDLYDESEGDGVIYLNCSAGYYASQNESAAYFDEIAKLLLSLKVGECALYKSSYGYHVLMRYEAESGAYDKEENKDAFANFYADLIARLFEKTCAERASGVVIDEKVFEGAPTMKDVGSNAKY